MLEQAFNRRVDSADGKIAEVTMTLEMVVAALAGLIVAAILIFILSGGNGG